MGSDLVNKTEKDFESIKHIDENGVEFWYARELMTMLEYLNLYFYSCFPSSTFIFITLIILYFIIYDNIFIGHLTFYINYSIFL